MTNSGGSKTAADLPISVDPPGARINDSVALVSLPSQCLWDELWSGAGVPQRRPFSGNECPGLAAALTSIIWVPAAWTSERGEQSTRLADV
jgi:hypothetical protein